MDDQNVLGEEEGKEVQRQEEEEEAAAAEEEEKYEETKSLIRSCKVPGALNLTAASSSATWRWHVLCADSTSVGLVRFEDV